MSVLADFLITAAIRLFSAYTFFRVVHIFHSETVYGKKVEVFFFIGYEILSQLTVIFIKVPLQRMIISILLLVLLTINYCSSKKIKALSVIFISMLYLCTEISVAGLMGYKVPIFTPLLEKHPVNGEFYVNLTVYIIMLIISRFKEENNKSKMPATYWFLAISVPLLTFYLVLVVTTQILTLYQVAINSIAILFVNVGFFYVIDKLMGQSDIKLIQQVNRSYQTQMHIYKVNISNLDRLRHDIKSELNLASSFINQKNLEEAKKYVAKIYLLIEDKNQVDTGVEIFDSIINLKILEAKQLGIVVEEQIAIPQELEVGEKIIPIIDCIMDYAISMVSESENKKIRIKVIFVFKLGRFIIEVIVPNSLTKAAFEQSQVMKEAIEGYKGFVKIIQEEGNLKIHTQIFIDMEKYI